MAIIASIVWLSFCSVMHHHRMRLLLLNVYALAPLLHFIFYCCCIVSFCFAA